jgi:hypothetical protein
MAQNGLFRADGRRLTTTQAQRHAEYPAPNSPKFIPGEGVRNGVNGSS